jgi:hypothetical protein
LLITVAPLIIRSPEINPVDQREAATGNAGSIKLNLNGNSA